MPEIALKNRLYIDVPREEKAEAKQAGAKWDRDRVSWYIDKRADTSPFVRWVLEQGTHAALHVIKRHYLAVPYEERHMAKEGGAKWDNTRKLWYIEGDADLEFFKVWLPENQVEPSVKSPQDDFADAMKSIGFIIEGEHPLFDGQKHRIQVIGDTGDSVSGFYIGFMNDGHPGGYAMNNRTREEVKWFAATGRKYTAEQRTLFNEQMHAKRDSFRQQQELRQQEAAERVNRKLEALQPAISVTPYLKRKNIGFTTDTYIQDETTLCIPHYDIEGKIWSLTYILEDGTKRYTKDGRKVGCFHVVNGFAQLESLERFVITEGYSTAVTLSEALGFFCIAAFDNGNLLAVASALHRKYPNRPVIIAGDDDRYVEKLHGMNPGYERACEAAETVGGKAVFPVFTPEEMQEDSKEFTDWNDLANKSRLGKAEFLRQVKEAFMG